MFAIPHSIRRKIDYQYAFISQLLDHFPTLFKEWENGLRNEFAKQAQEIADGDKEIEHDVYENMSSWIDSQYDEILATLAEKLGYKTKRI